MAPATSSLSSSASQRHVGFIRRTQAPKLRHPSPEAEAAVEKYRTMMEIMAKARYVVLERDSYNDLSCEQCGSGDLPEELLLCDKCDKGFHMKCVRPIVVRIPIGSWLCPKCSGQKKKRVGSFSQKKIFDFFGIQADKTSSQGSRKRRKRSGPQIVQKKKRRLLPFVPSGDPAQRLKQMGSLASALTALNIEYSDHITYLPSMAPRSANEASLESGGMQNLTKEDTETMEHCKAMSKRGECPPFVVVFDSCEGYTVEADGPIKDMTFIAEYTGDVDYLKKRERDDCDSIMTLLSASEPADSLVICADKRGNISRFISGINNHTREGKKKLNCKCIRYSVNGESRVFLVATRDIAKGERLYYDYNGYEDEYPTHHFV
ncbi:putative histone-lysine N-methyltransferase transcription regulator PHD family [Lupinus albus]|uniref:[histone H3]-lysine(27) N-methyltransferase n=1 Tax=Lupinus albus TaxID=3870 RepID=A0A6A4N8U1_LUPAL|nr:putative histone-lysine N-methyltransferase transcription regulator PHD family [Lupinus albus]